MAVCQAAKEAAADEVPQEEEGVGQLALPGIAADLQAGRYQRHDVAAACSNGCQ